MQHDIPRGSKEQEFEECVEDLLHHLIILLLGSKQVLQQLNQIRACNHGGDLIVPANGAHQHNTLQENIILSILINQVVVHKLNEVVLSDFLLPQI